MNIFRKVLDEASNHGKSTLKRIDYLDGWRGIAIASVLVAHFCRIDYIRSGRMGVDIFFVLSGMLMSNILFVKRTPLGLFYKRRISRILPVFFLYVSLVCLIGYVLDISAEPKNFFYLISFLRTYFPESPHPWQTGLPVGHLWSLNVEEHCYVLLSLVTLVPLFRGREYIPLIGLGLAAVALRYYYNENFAIAPAHYEIRTETAASFLLLSSGYFLLRDKVAPYVYSWMPIVTFIVGVLCYTRLFPWTTTWLLAPFMFAFTVNHLGNLPEFLKKALSNNLIRLLGIYSYSIYLWQQPFYLYGADKFGNTLTLNNMLFLFLALLMGVGSFYFIEKPIRTYMNNHW